jgi:hypothetical protein
MDKCQKDYAHHFGQIDLNMSIVINVVILIGKKGGNFDYQFFSQI